MLPEIVMQALVGFGVLALIGWIAVQLLPVLLPLLGYLLAGVVALIVLSLFVK